jgi:O-antigen/teichoic acid export membrane protein
MTAPDGSEPTATQGPLARRLRRGAVLAATGLGLSQAVALGQTLVVARLLGPVVVGSFAAGIVLIGVLQMAGTGGLRQALIQRPDADLDEAAVTALWASLSTGVLTAGCAAVVAPLLGEFFGDPVAGTVALAIAGVQILHALGQVPDALLQRRFQFRRRIVVDPSMVLANAVVSVTLCALGFGVWGPVAGLYAHELAFVVSAWWLAGWRPRGGRPSLRLWREMTRFASPLVVGGLLERAQQALEGIVLGRLLGTPALGLYRYGRRIGEAPGKAVIDVGSYVLFPAFARIAHETERFRSGYLRAVRALWAATVPVGGLLATVGAPAVVVLLGDGWRGAAPAVAAMAGWAPGIALSGAGAEALKGAGRSRAVLALSATGAVVVVGLLCVLAPVWGLAGAGAALSAGSMAAGVLAVVLARRTVGAGGRDLIAALAPPLLAAVPAVVVTAGLENLLRADTRATLPAVGCLVLDVLAFAAVYLLVLRAVVGRQAPAREHPVVERHELRP